MKKYIVALLFAGLCTLNCYSNPCDSITIISCGSPVVFSPAGGAGDANWPNGMYGSLCLSSAGRGGLESVYKFVAPATGTYQLKVTAAPTSNMVEYFYKNGTGGCFTAGWICLGTANIVKDIGAVNINAGDSILIMANAESTNAFNQTFQINCAIPFPLTTIQTITCGTSVTFQPAGGYGNPAYPNGMPAASNCTTNSYYSGQGGIEKIYKFIAPTSGTYQINVTGVNGGSSTNAMEYYYKPCSNCTWFCLNVANGSKALGAFNLNMGDSVLILVNVESTAIFSQTFQVNCAIPFPCTTIQTISCGSNVTFQNPGGYGNPDYPNLGSWSNGFCGNSSDQGGLERIYKFVAPATGAYPLKITSVTNGGVVEYAYRLSSAATQCISVGWNCVGYSNFAGPLNSLNLNAGDTILIQANAESVNQYTQSFELGCASTAVARSTTDQFPIRLYPNPFSVFATLETDEDVGDALLYIYSVLGQELKIIKPTGKRQFTVNRSYLVNGLYYYKLMDDNTTYATGKLIVK